jgi:hypothetical protein
MGCSNYLFKQLKARLEIDSLQAFEKVCACAPCWPFGSSGRRLSGTTGGTARLSGADGGAQCSAPAPNRTATSRKLDLDARANLLCSCGGLAVAEELHWAIMGARGWSVTGRRGRRRHGWAARQHKASCPFHCSLLAFCYGYGSLPFANRSYP